MPPCTCSPGRLVCEEGSPWTHSPGSECVRRLPWRRACMGAWTGRCRCGSCVSWGIGAWPASSRGPPSGSASCSGPAPRGSAGAGRRGSSPPSPPWTQGRTHRLKEVQQRSRAQRTEQFSLLGETESFKALPSPLCSCHTFSFTLGRSNWE